MEVKGNLIKKINERCGQGSNGAWRIASYLITTTEEGSFARQHQMVIEVSDGANQRIERFDGMFGKDVVISFDIDAREYHGKWYNSLRAWGIREEGSAEADDPAMGSQQGGQTEQDGQQGITTKEDKKTEAVDWDGMGNNGAEPPF